MGLPVIANVVPKLTCVTFMLLMPLLASATLHGTYSSLKYSGESGDINGYEVEFIPTNKGLRAVVQTAQGEINGIYVVDVSEGKDMQVSFLIPLNTTEKQTFVVRAYGNELRGTILLPAGSQNLILKRTTGYWNQTK